MPILRRPLNLAIKRSRSIQARSSDQGPISTIKILDPGRKRFHRRCVSDYPLKDHYTRCESTVIASIGNFNVQITIKCFAFTVSVATTSREHCTYVLWFVGKVYPWPRIGLLSLGEAVWDEPAQYISMRAPETTRVVPNRESLS